jgi:hypothetical protein
VRELARRQFGPIIVDTVGADDETDLGLLVRVSPDLFDPCCLLKRSGCGVLAEPTGLEPATSDVTGRRSNQLNYDSANSNVIW